MCLTGLRDVEVFCNEKMEAVAGQNVTLPCVVRNHTDLKIVSIEWRKDRNENTKLALYSRGFGINLFWPNVTMQIDTTSMGTYLQLYGVAKWDSGVYICDITSFPLGSIRRETELKIKGKMKASTCKAIPQPGAAVFTGFNIWIEMCNNFLSYCPIHIFHVTPDCIRAPLLCQSQQLFTSEQMYVMICKYTSKSFVCHKTFIFIPVFGLFFLFISHLVVQ